MKLTRVLFGGLVAVAAFAQDVISAKSGLIHFVEGAVTVDGREVENVKRTELFSQFPQVKQDQVLATAAGRAEILLTPGVALRVGEDTQIRMVAAGLENTQVELIAGDIVLEVADVAGLDDKTSFDYAKAAKQTSVAILYKGYVLVPTRTGAYRVGTDPAELKVYDGQMKVIAQNETATAKKGRAVSLAPGLAVAKFDAELGDALTRWSARRAGYMAAANISAAKYARENSGMSSFQSGWYYNSFYGMFTFLPANGVYCSAWAGYCFYSPQRIYAVYYPQVYSSPRNNAGFSQPTYGYDANRGYTVSSQRTYGGGDYTGGAAATAAAAPAASAPARSAESATGRGAAGGGRSQ